MAAAFGFIYWKAATAESRQNVELKIIYPGPVTGLPVGGQVLFNGIKVGDVKSLDFAPDDPTIRAVASDTAINLNKPVFDLNDTAAITDFILMEVGLA